MPIVRKKLDPAEIYPTGMRYNAATDSIETNVNGTWVANPDADPRTQTKFPPRTTADTRCDAAESVKDAFKSQIDKTLLAIEGASTTFTIAGSILALFWFGPFGVFISLALGLATAMVGAGSEAIRASLTTAAYHTFACILDCHMDASGKVTAADVSAIQSDTTAQIGGIGAVILNSMLQIAGFGGVNNLAALGTSTGSCGDCGCGWCYNFDFTVGEQGWSVVPGSGGAWSGVWNSTTVLGAGSAYYNQCYIEITIPATEITMVTCGGVKTRGDSFPDVDGIQLNSSFVYTWDANFNGRYDKVWTGSVTGVTVIRLYVIAGENHTPPGGNVSITNCLIRGTGVNPFGTDNC